VNEKEKCYLIDMGVRMSIVVGDNDRQIEDAFLNGYT
jgi:hypothetical protein